MGPSRRGMGAAPGRRFSTGRDDAWKLVSLRGCSNLKSARAVFMLTLDVQGEKIFCRVGHVTGRNGLLHGRPKWVETGPAAG